jgi:hypothetical protein
MAKNDFMARKRAEQRAYFDAGLQSGRQQIMDMLTLVLRDPDIMGKDVFGKDRLIKVCKGIGEYIDTYNLAWQKHDETDYWRDKLDKELAQAYGEGMLDSFLQRYEYAPEYDYWKGKWKK